VARLFVCGYKFLRLTSAAEAARLGRPDGTTEVVPFPIVALTQSAFESLTAQFSHNRGSVVFLEETNGGDAGRSGM
jgi:hypothetical protein